LNEKNQVPPKIPSKITFPLVPGVQGQLFVATSVFRKFHDFSCGFKPISSPFRIPNMLEASNILDDDPLSHLSHPPPKKQRWNNVSQLEMIYTILEIRFGISIWSGAKNHKD
jgi:hypothetical protein